MLTTARRTRLPLWAWLLVPLVTGFSIVGIDTTSPHVAHASCSGAGSPATLKRYDSNNNLVAEEAVAYPGTTCDNDYTYVGAVLDPITDGSCAYAYYLEVFQYYAAQGTSCTTGQWVVYSYTDSIGTNSVYVSPRTSYQSDSWTLSWGY
jgi:hypothetical protein